MTKRIILLLFLALLISGCSQPGPIKLPESAYEKSELRETDYKSISEKINSGENFILYVYTNHCEACMSFKPVLEEFIEERGITIFAIEKAAIEKGSKLDKEVKLAPTVLIIGNKKTIARLDPNRGKDKAHYETSDGFASWFDKHVINERP